MKINKDHEYHGAALIQIAEYPTFKAINPFALADKTNSRSAFVINTDAAVYLKYATKTTKAFKEHVFGFSKSNIAELDELKAHFKSRVFVVFVCLRAHEICVLTLDELLVHVARRKIAKGEDEDQYSLCLHLAKNKAFRAYMNAPGKKKETLKPQIVARNRFPRAIFEPSA
jgi:hypothetical protein